MNIALSSLVAGRQNPRRVKPEREAHRRLVASIRAHGILEPLLVRPIEGKEGKYGVIAGNRRLAALREVFRGKGEDAKVPCILKRVDEDTASAMGLAENFAREPMHPLDEAEAFARLAADECLGVPAIAEQFGVSETYVRQRMKLAGLAGIVKSAFRENEITVGIAEAFSAVPPERQVELWQEMDGKPRDARHVKGVIENEWIAAGHALFDIGSLDPNAVSHDLFGGSILVQRSVFLQAQTAALTEERSRLLDDGWREVIVAEPDAVRDRIYSMAEAEPQYDKATEAKLAKLRAKRKKLEDTPTDTAEAEEKLIAALEALDDEEQAITENRQGAYSEATKAAGSVFLLLHADGRVERRHLIPRKHGKGSGRGAEAESNGAGDGESKETLPTSDELSPRQIAELHTHEALSVREAVGKDKLVRKRLIVLALHPKVRHDGLAIRRDMNPTTLHASQSDFRSPLRDTQQERVRDTVPFPDAESLDEAEAYTILTRLTEKQLDAAIAMLIAETITGHGHRATPLVQVLAKELGVSLRTRWTPDAEWLAGYQKAQLAHLSGTLRGEAHGTAALSRKKSELVEELAALFSQAATDPKGIPDAAVAERANVWLPAVLREEAEVSETV